jgi:hypothetical protein
MIERGMSSQVSGESEVELKCLRMIEERRSPKGCLAFSFIGQGKGLGYTRERERETEKETTPGAMPLLASLTPHPLGCHP